jgi:hypothetical protein
MFKVLLALTEILRLLKDNNNDGIPDIFQGRKAKTNEKKENQPTEVQENVLENSK